MTRRTMSGGFRVLAATSVALVGVACGESEPLGPEAPAPQQEAQAGSPVVVSEPIVYSSTVPVVDSVGPAGVSDGDSVAYVSFSPGSVPRADQAAIKNLANGFSRTVRVVDGGLDPTPIKGAAGDTLEIRLLRGGQQLNIWFPIIPFFRPPRVVRTQPLRGKRDLPLNSNIVVVFSEPIDSTTVTRGGIELRKAGVPVPADVLVSSDRLSARLVPRTPLEAGATYWIVVATQVRDLAGDTLEQEYRSHFTTVGASAPTAPPAPPLRFVSVAAGSFHTCGLATDGDTYCWGMNIDGQLGDGTTATSGSPEIVVGGLRFDQLAAGAERSCGITAAGFVYCWGSNGTLLGHNFQGGLIPDDDSGYGEWSYTAPVRVSPVHRFMGLGVAGERNCGWKADGSMYCWGIVEDSIHGGGSSALWPETPSWWMNGDSTWFMPVPGPPVLSLTVGDRHTCGLDASGTASCRGWNAEGQLGNGTTTLVLDSDLPTPVAGNLTFQSLSAGQRHTCGVTTGGAAYCWGDNSEGQLGDGSLVDSYTPVPVTGGIVFTTVFAGAVHSCGLDSGGDAYCWGSNALGQLGDGNSIGVPPGQPRKVVGGLSFSALAAGLSHTCGLATGGVAYCWGQNLYGALGAGYLSAPIGVPVKVALQ